MKKLFLSLIAAGSVFAAPFDIKIGASSFAQLKAQIPCKITSDESEDGMRAIGYEECAALEDLQSIELVFDAQNTLQIASFKFAGAANFERLGEQIAREVHYDFEPVPPVADRQSVFTLPKYAIIIEHKKAAPSVQLIYMGHEFMQQLLGQ